MDNHNLKNMLIYDGHQHMSRTQHTSGSSPSSNNIERRGSKLWTES